jgi:hypothetical protein
MPPAQYGFGMGAQPFNPMPQAPPSPYGFSAGSLWKDLQQAPGVGFIPGLSTATQWNEMGPWGRSASLGLDALDLATMGTGKLGTTPLKMALTWGGKWLGRNDPTHTYLRSANLPTVEGLEDMGLIDEGVGTILEASLGNPLNPYIPSINWMENTVEPGISVYQGLKFPGKGNPQYLMKPAEDILLNRGLTSKSPHYKTRGPYRKIENQIPYYEINPLESQRQMMELGPDDARELFEVRGTPMERVLGSDLEAMLDPRTAGYVSDIPIPREQVPLYDMEHMLASVQDMHRRGGYDRTYGMTLSDMDNITALANKWDIPAEFAKYDQFGNRINPLWYDRIPDLPWMPPYLGTTPATVPTRGFINRQ